MHITHTVPQGENCTVILRSEMKSASKLFGVPPVISFEIGTQ